MKTRDGLHRLPPPTRPPRRQARVLVRQPTLFFNLLVCWLYNRSRWPAHRYAWAHVLLGTKGKRREAAKRTKRSKSGAQLNAALDRLVAAKEREEATEPRKTSDAIRALLASQRQAMEMLGQFMARFNSVSGISPTQSTSSGPPASSTPQHAAAFEPRNGFNSSGSPLTALEGSSRSASSLPPPNGSRVGSGDSSPICQEEVVNTSQNARTDGAPPEKRARRSVQVQARYNISK